MEVGSWSGALPFPYLFPSPEIFTSLCGNTLPILLGRYTTPTGTVDAALEDGNMEMLRWLLDRFEVSVDVAKLTSDEQYEFAEWALSAHRNKCVGLKWAVVEAAGRGKLELT